MFHDENLCKNILSYSLRACQDEEEICQESLREAFKFVFLPYEINKFPCETLGFGTYMAYFSKLLVKENSKFLVKKDLSEEEEWVRSFQAEVLGSLSSLDVGKMSIILHRNNFKMTTHFVFLSSDSSIENR